MERLNLGSVGLLLFSVVWIIACAGDCPDGSTEAKSLPLSNLSPVQVAYIVDDLYSFDGTGAVPRQFETLRGEVAEKIHEIVRLAYQHYVDSDESGEGRPARIEDFYGSVFCIPSFGGRKLYMFKLYWLGRRSPSEFEYHFLMFDPETKAVTQKPFSIYGSRIQSFRNSGIFCKPLIHFYDLNQDGAPEVAVEQVIHNGTMYNCAIHHYFHIDENMSFVRLLALESRVAHLFSNEKGVIVRRISRLKPGEVKISVNLQIPRGAPSEEELGHVILASKDNSSPFQVTRKSVASEQYRGVLITASGLNESDFLRDGYNGLNEKN